jgi:predicted ATPase/DNA-binding winged helix-turn-helix (wHTH) protein
MDGAPRCLEDPQAAHGGSAPPLFAPECRQRRRRRVTVRRGGDVQGSHRFGRVEVRPTERLLLVDGQAAAVGARAFDLLLAFIERRDRLVTKNELLDTVWPGLVVEENNLAVQVSALRKVLGPQAIVTIPGRGYRFAAPLDEQAATTSTATEPDAQACNFPALPVAPTALLGRDDDLASLDELLQHGALVTVVGASGIGKTSLALACAQRRRADYPDGVAWVGLAETGDAAQVLRAVGQATGLPVVDGEDALPALLEALRPLRLLLVLDNAEHVLDELRHFARAVAVQAPGVRLLVTSQAALKLEGERLFRLGPLALPPAGALVAEAQAHAAVALFAEHARAVDRRFALTDENVGAVIELCRHLDGVALAIKLAAARVPVLGLRGLAARLGDRLKLFRNADPSVPPRQQTLQAALDWSHGLLDANGQRVFRRLAVCAGGFTVETAAAIVGCDTLDEWAVIETLGELVDRSLVEVEGTTQPRYRMLETARAYARLKLDEAGEREATQARHAEAMAVLMDTAYDAYWMSGDRAWLQAVEPEIENLRLALAWSTAQRPQIGLRLVGSAGPLFLITGQAPEARRFFAALEPFAAVAGGAPGVARFWLERSRVCWGISSAQMHAFALRAVELYRAAGDLRGLYLALRCAAGSGAATVDEAHAMLDEMAAVERLDWPARLRSQRLLAEIIVLSASSRFDEVRSVCDTLLSMASAANLDSVASVALVSLASTHLALAEPDRAVERTQEFLALPGAQRGNFVLLALATQVSAHLMKNSLVDARDAAGRLISASRSRGWEWFGQYADLFALLAAAEGRAEDAARLIGHADAAYRRAGLPRAMSTKARDQAMTTVERTLDAAMVARLLDDGQRMDEETICAVTLAGTQAAGRCADVPLQPGPR